MKSRILILVLAATFAGVLAAGCNATSGATTADATAVPSSPPSANNPNFTPADPAAQAKMEQQKVNEDIAAGAKTGANVDSASGPAEQGNTAGDGVTPPKAGEKVAVIDTNFGRIVFKFRPDLAPKTVANFEKLAGKKFYDGTKFHRVIPNFMIQGGDPNSKGSDRSTYGIGDAGYKIPAEFNNLSHTRGTVSMARSQDPDSASCQFFICVGNPTNLDHQYTGFGQVVKGMDVADKIVNLPRDDRDDPTPDEAIMKTVRIETWPLKG